MDEGFTAVVIVATVCVGLPWVLLHYITRWKTAPKITNEDEKLLDELFTLARRLEDRLGTVERIIAADNPDFRTNLPLSSPISDYDPTQFKSSGRN